jgi:hypothetical protein
MILTEKEKNRIRKLHEATTASASGSYNQPMGFTEPVEVVDLENTFLDGEINLDIDDVVNLLSITTEEENKRIRNMHRDNSTIKEQIVEIPSECLKCVEKSLGKYSDKAEKITLQIMKVMEDGEVSEAEAIVMITNILSELASISVLDLVPIATKLWECQNKCN